MQAGQARHGESWRTRGDAVDLAHAHAHLRSLEAGDGAEDHLAHALTRLAIIAARREHVVPSAVVVSDANPKTEHRQK
jgi:hypothetical protein